MTRAHPRPLGGIDVCLLAMDGVMARDGLGANRVSHVVICEGRLDAGRIRRALERLLRRCPWLGARARRPFPWGPPSWSVPRGGALVPRVREDVTGDVDLERTLRGIVDERLSASRDNGHEAPLTLDVVVSESERRSGLVLTWFHPLMDPRGAENAVAWMDALDRDASLVTGGDGPTPLTVEHPPRAWVERLERARAGRAVMESYLDTPPRSLGAAALARDAGLAPGARRTRHIKASFTDASGRSPRAQREMTFRLAVVGRALAPLFETRGLDGCPYLLPVSVDRRKRGDPGPVMGNHLHLHHASFVPGEPGATAAALRLALANALRHDHLAAKSDLLGLVGWAPLRWVSSKMAPGEKGDTASFHFADTGAAHADLPELLGCPILDAWHVPSLPVRPGLGVFLNRHGSCENVVITWVEDVVTEPEVTRLLGEIRDGMGWAKDAGCEAGAPTVTAAAQACEARADRTP